MEGCAKPNSGCEGNLARLIFAVVIGLVCAACGTSGHPSRYWTKSQAESIRSVRGTPLKTTTCTGRGEERESGYRRFFCVGVHWPKGLGYSLPVRIRYVLAPLGQYRGTQPPYKLTWVRFDSFGVP
jgi:hypothetical protein